MNDSPPQDQDPQATLERRLKQSDLNERRAATEFLEQSRPHLVAGRTLPWDSFWARIAQGFDGFLWRWFGNDVEVARAQEEETQRRISKSKNNAAASPNLPASKNSNNDSSPQA